VTAATDPSENGNGRGPLKVLYLIGWGRSGSTLIDTLLGEVPGFFSAGELRNIWKEGLREGRSCGCGRPVLDCPVWSPVLDLMRGSVPFRPNAMTSVQERSLRARHALPLIRRVRTGRRLAGGVTSTTEQLYRAIQEVTGARVIVDSSKVPSNAAILATMPTIQPHLLHLVRDPRASAYSWQRQRERLDGKDDELLPRFGLVESSSNWVLFNVAAELMARQDRFRYLQLRYEDFVRDPRSSLEAVVRWTGEPSDALPFTDRAVASLGDNHTVGGNPGRFRTGRVEIREDAEWRTQQHASHRLLVTTLTLPLLRRYGYAARIGDAGAQASV